MDNPIEFSVGQPTGYGFSVPNSVGVTVIGVADVVVNNESVVDEDKVARFSVPTQLSQLSPDTTHRLVTDTEKSTWDGKYTKPSSGIPKTDLASAVQTSLGKADNAISDAPSDGNQYARKDGAWAVVQGGGGVDGAVRYDQSQSLTNAQKAQARANIATGEVLMADVTYYVSPSGNDNNDGSQAYPFKTIQHAIDVLPKNLNGHTVTIIPNMASGDSAYTENIAIQGFYSGLNIFIGTLETGKTWSLLGGVQVSALDSSTVVVYNCSQIKRAGSANKCVEARSNLKFSVASGLSTVFDAQKDTSQYACCVVAYAGLVELGTSDANQFYYRNAYIAVQNYSDANIQLRSRNTIENTCSKGVQPSGGLTKIEATAGYFTNNAATKYNYAGGIVVKGTTINPTT